MPIPYYPFDFHEIITYMIFKTLTYYGDGKGVKIGLEKR